MRSLETQRARLRRSRAVVLGGERQPSRVCARIGLAAGIPVLLLGAALLAATGSGRDQIVHAAQQEPMTANVPADSPSGEAMPVGDIPGWHQVFADDFTTPVPLGSFPGAVAAKWDAYPDGWNDTTKNGTYYPSKVISVQNGVLNMHLHTENGIHMVSAPEPKIPGAVGSEGGLLYGRYVIRFRSDPIPGYKTAWLLWPDSEAWPRDGEIDFPEGGLDKTISAYMHRQNGTSGDDQDAFDSSVTYTSWHTATLEWLPSSVKFYLDGQLLGTSTSRIPNTPMHWVIQTETATDGSVPSDSAAGNVQIDWVSVYVPGSASPTPPPTPVPPSTPAATAASSPAPRATPPALAQPTQAGSSAAATSTLASTPTSPTSQNTAATPASVPTQAANGGRRDPPTGADSSPASAIESLASKAGIPTTVVTFLSSAVAYTRRLRKTRVHRLLFRRRRW